MRVAPNLARILVGWSCNPAGWTRALRACLQFVVKRPHGEDEREESGLFDGPVLPALSQR